MPSDSEILQGKIDRWVAQGKVDAPLRLKAMSIGSIPQGLLPDTVRILHIGGNSLRRLPDLPESLVELSCESNQISELPSLPEGLTSLNVSGNKLTKLPPLPPNLRVLICSGNRELKKIPEIPNSVEELSCHSCALTKLPKLSDALKKLDCSYNTKLRKLPSKIPEDLEELNCEGITFHTPDGRSIEGAYLEGGEIDDFLDDLYSESGAADEESSDEEEADEEEAENEDKNSNAPSHRNTYPLLNKNRNIRNNAVPDTVYDPVMANEVPVNEYVAEDDNIVFVVGDSAYGFPREELFKGAEDASRIVYECKGKKGLMVRKTNVHFDEPYYRLMAPGALAIPMKQFEKVLHSKHRIWRIVDAKKRLDYVANRRIIFGDRGNASVNGYDVDVSSADHCSEGTALKVYHVEPVRARARSTRKNNAARGGGRRYPGSGSARKTARHAKKRGRRITHRKPGRKA